MDRLNIIEENKSEIFAFLRKISEQEKSILLQSEIEKFLINFKEHYGVSDEIMGIILYIQEMVIFPPQVYIALRYDIGLFEYIAFDLDSLQFTSVKVSSFLSFKERLVGVEHSQNWSLRLDIEPFNRDFPKITNKNDIGDGIEFLNNHLSSKYFNKSENRNNLLEFLTLHSHNGIQFMLNERITTIEDLYDSLMKAQGVLEQKDGSDSFESVKFLLQNLGFEKGWGKDIATTLESMKILDKVLKNFLPQDIESFLDRIPMVFNVVIVSPHGFFGQSKVLGFPDTGGQVVYILDQVRALEEEMMARIERQGLEIEPQIVVLTRLIPNSQGTTCHERVEHIWGTKYSKILRVPFRDEGGEVLEDWISRFHIWPYLERFALDAIPEIKAELNNKPDLIIGNYSDGNLVATLLSQNLKVTQCNIAHALEKSKYLFSALYWRDNEDEYHFSSQFTADLIGMNSADFIISSTYQEIAGSQKSVGQYESYKSFTMPGLYQVVNGIDVYDSKFNIISPGANDEIFFDFKNEEKRLKVLEEDIVELLYGEPNEISRGKIEDRDRPIIFSIARLDRVKNIISLVRWFANSDYLKERAYLFIIAGHVNIENSKDDEERAQIEQMHNLFNQYGLDSSVRWVGTQLEKQLTGELYRFIASRRGFFVQPALFEAFGLTVVESMSTGLPTFATCFGGPMEIIEDGVSGFHIDPTDDESTIAKLEEFLKKSIEDSSIWESISAQSIKRVEERYNWKRYANRLLTLAKVYGFWKHVTNKDREEIRRYLEMFYGLMFRPMVQKQIDKR